MMRRASIGIALLALSHLACANVTSAFAQAGSTGGTIGKQDKSISGGDQIEKPGNLQQRKHREESPSRQVATTLTGPWDWKASCYGVPYTGALRLVQSAGGQLSGKFLSDSGAFQGGTITGLASGTQINFTRTNSTGSIRYTAVLGSPQRMEGSATQGIGGCSFTATKR
jgi:hypothetical protein